MLTDVIRPPGSRRKPREGAEVVSRARWPTVPGTDRPIARTHRWGIADERCPSRVGYANTEGHARACPKDNRVSPAQRKTIFAACTGTRGHRHRIVHLAGARATRRPRAALAMSNTHDVTHLRDGAGDQRIFRGNPTVRDESVRRVRSAVRPSHPTALR